MRYWRDTILSLAPESPVLLVATHVDERAADLPLAELQRDYPNVVGSFPISNSKRGAALNVLSSAVQVAAAGLPLMGVEWPRSWREASDDLAAIKDKWITPKRLRDVFEERGVSGRELEQLGDSLHELGKILYFRKVKDLQDWVILDPKWVTTYISRVFDSKEVRERDPNVDRPGFEKPLAAVEVLGAYGIFTVEHMREIWADLDGPIQEHFLKLMEQFDLSYRTLEDEDISIVVERLSLDETDYSTEWEAATTGKEIVMNYQLNSTIPAGIPTWFIARSHRFTTYKHWKLGALFKDDQTNPQHWALLQADADDQTIRIVVRGPAPHAFFTKLRDGLEVTLKRFPGLVEKIERTMPCLGVNGAGCPEGYEFNVGDLERRLCRTPPKLAIECPKEIEDVQVMAHLYGLHISTESAVIERLEKLFAKQTEELTSVLKTELTGLRELTQREFLKAYAVIQEIVDESVPNVFLVEPDPEAAAIGTLFSRSEATLSTELCRKIRGERMYVQLYCQEPGHWHRTLDGGRYEITEPAEWLRRASPYLRGMMKYFRFAAAVAPSGLEALGGKLEDNFKAMLNFNKALASQLPQLEPIREQPFDEREKKERHEHGPALRALLERNGDTSWSGLTRKVTPEGHILWLCPEHLAKYR